MCLTVRRTTDRSPRMLDELASGELTLPIERYGLDGLAEAVERLRTGEAVGKVALDLS
ncbi:hypothetical protein GCM10010094_23070 [Streptomyces flaveus]|uniref:Alcohol dehydrogenase n=1 Tax=Streptomyces flaveus TaxID=66370 RepID=A0A917QPL1_9ACTN|nr:hypothetical protein GCM10010094_23070 [Streptomyces flaveus]